jgi:hypothetical protein
MRLSYCLQSSCHAYSVGPSRPKLPFVGTSNRPQAVARERRLSVVRETPLESTTYYLQRHSLLEGIVSPLGLRELTHVPPPPHAAATGR